MPESSYSNIKNMLNQQGVEPSSNKHLRAEPKAALHDDSYHYINVQQALDRQVDEMLTDPNRYQAGLFLQPAAKTPELSNLENLGLPKVIKALIAAEVMIHGDEKDKNTIKNLYSKDQVSEFIAFADKARADKAAHVNANRVVRASYVDEPEDILMYGEDDNNTKFVPHALRRG